VLSLLFLVGLIMVVDDGSNQQYANAGQTCMTISWFAFLCDYVIRFTLLRLGFISSRTPFFRGSRFSFPRCGFCCLARSCGP
jgi:hypothetical protein